MDSILSFTESLKSSPLGTEVQYRDTYDSALLFPISRAEKRAELGIGADLPFHGVDIWNAFEISWLNPKGKPVVAVAEFRVPCNSKNIIESKSFKLYLNSLNGTKFSSKQAVYEKLVKDLSLAAQGPVSIKLFQPDDLAELSPKASPGICLDNLDVEIDEYLTNAKLLRLTDGSWAPTSPSITNKPRAVTEFLYSHLLKSNCPVTGQPDWGTVEISYTGHQIDRESLLKYIVSYRNHNEFHEQCVERIFCDIMKFCQPRSLTVSARYTRRGGLDINPYRSTEHILPANNRSFRQ